MQRIALGAITDLAVREAPPEVRIQYRRPGLRHIISTALGVGPEGVVSVDASRVRITEVSRARNFALTMPTRAVRAVTGDLTRRLFALILGVLLAALGLAAAVFGVAARQDWGWWPTLERELSADHLFVIAGVLLGLSLVSFIVYALRKDLVLTFDAGAASGGRIRLHRSWRFPLRLEDALRAVGTVADIVVAAAQPPRAEPTPAWPLPPPAAPAAMGVPPPAPAPARVGDPGSVEVHLTGDASEDARRVVDSIRQGRPGAPVVLDGSACPTSYDAAIGRLLDEVSALGIPGTGREVLVLGPVPQVGQAAISVAQRRRWNWAEDGASVLVEVRTPG